MQRHPSTYQIVHETYRRATVRRFPYVVFYEFNEQEIIIYAVFHCSQDPENVSSMNLSLVLTKVQICLSRP
ncbi:type II toxin-antitoxin system RelE/ParE family toxin [Nostoc sphaeroides]|uniref:type II toxin-antitoxin system RelE/ParE family toxin n=1 Tax=Nostoc sphaeroides TaxID=446679 RepID=UPI002269B1C5|nr:type II toxin-antitoxin system RelE/ParE family toxin [Nostoc sphaeroides]